jgi:glycosyltransferase involved in cell wall biosynthesis
MSNKPLVTIVTPSYNQAEFLEKTMLSVISQDYPNIEYIIIDGGSDDDSVNIIKKHESKIHYWVSEKDAGQTSAINKGFAKANGKYIAWLNSDDTYEPGAISFAIDYLENHPDVGLFYGDTNFIDENDILTGKFPAAQTNYKKLRQGYVHVAQQSSFWRKSLWDKVGPLDESFYFAMDYDLWTRLAKVSGVKYIPRTLSNFRLHGDSKTISEDDRCWPEMLQVHYRDGGNKISIIVAKYYIRLLLAPLVKYRTQLRMKK